MTITERNYMQTRLREEMYHHAFQADWCREQILQLNREYKEQNLDLYKEMFVHDSWIYYCIHNSIFTYTIHLLSISKECQLKQQSS